MFFISITCFAFEVAWVFESRVAQLRQTLGNYHLSAGTSLTPAPLFFSPSTLSSGSGREGQKQKTNILLETALTILPAHRDAEKESAGTRTNVWTITKDRAAGARTCIFWSGSGMRQRCNCQQSSAPTCACACALQKS